MQRIMKKLLLLTILGIASWTSQAQTALNFDGVDDHVALTRSNVGLFGHTIEAWVRTSSAASGSAYAGNPALTVVGDNANDVGMTFGIDNGAVQYNHFNGVWNTANGVTSINDGLWHHVAVTHETDNTVRIYVDGAIDNTASIALTANTTYTSYNTIGASYLGGASYQDHFDGDIDEVRIWTCVKSQPEILADISAAHTGTETGLVLFYDFSNGAGPIVSDLSTNGNDGSLANGPLWVPGVATLGAPTFAGCSAPTLIGAPVCQAASDAQGQCLEIIGNYMYMGHWQSVGPVQDGMIGIYDISVPGTATYVGSENHGQGGGLGNGIVLDLETDGTHLYTATRNREEFYVIDYSNPIDLNVIGTAALSPAPSAIPVALKVDGTNVFVVDNWGKLYTIDVSTPAAPVVTSTFLTGGNPSDIEIAGTVAYLANSTGLEVYDITNPNAPLLVTTITDAASYFKTYIVGTTLYASNGSDLYTYDISTPTAPVLQGAPLTLANEIYSFDVNGNDLYVGTNAGIGNIGALTLLDISTPTTPTVTDESPLATHRGREVVFDNGFVYSIDDFFTEELCIYGAAAPAVANNNHYWVGGPGNWSDDANHWANTSGGVPGSTTVPTFGDNAIFDDNSGLTALDVVNIDIPAEADTLTYDAVSNSFIFNNTGNDVTLNKSLIGNASGVNFTGAWGEFVFNTNTPSESITSGGTIFIQDFRMDGNEAITLNDDLDLTTGIMFVDSGGVDLAGFDLTCTAFESTTTSTRIINISNATVNVTDDLWDVDSTSLTLSATTSLVSLGDNAGNAIFSGGSLVYDTIRSTSATSLDYSGNNSTNWFEVVPSSQLSLGYWRYTENRHTDCFWHVRSAYHHYQLRCGDEQCY